MAERIRRGRGRSRTAQRAAIQSAVKRKPMTAVSGWPARTVTTNRIVSAVTVRPRAASSRHRSMRKSVHGQRQSTADCGKYSQGGVKEKERAKATAAKAAARVDAPSSRTQSQVPAEASSSLMAAISVNACASGQNTVRSVNGENAAETLLAASGIPHPFHRLRSGSAPSFNAVRVALAHGRIWVTTSFRFAL
jgi:hypothetical protein